MPSAQYHSAEYKLSVRADEAKNVCALVNRQINFTVADLINRVINGMSWDVDPADCSQIERDPAAIALFATELRSRAIEAGRVCCETICKDVVEAHEKMYAYEDAKVSEQMTE